MYVDLELRYLAVRQLHRSRKVGVWSVNPLHSGYPRALRTLFQCPGIGILRN